jgi:hypothetical protein
MALRESVAVALGEHAAALGISPATVEPGESLVVELDDVVVSFDYEDEAGEILWLRTRLGQLDAGDRAMFEGLLGVNLAGWAAGGFVITLEGDERRLVAGLPILAGAVGMETLDLGVGSLLLFARKLRVALAARDFDGDRLVESLAADAAG